MNAINNIDCLQKIFIIQLVAIMVFAVPLLAQAISADKKATEFANKSLNIYTTKLLTEQTAKYFDFKNLEEAKSAKLGNPIPVITVGLKEIKQYRSGSSIKSLDADKQTLYFPVLVGEQVRVKLEVIEKEGKLISGDFGAGGEAKRIDSVDRQLKEILTEKNVAAVSQKAILRIPHLKAIFFYLDTDQGDYLAPAMALPQRFNLQNAKLYAAEEVLKRLQMHAEKIPDDLIR
jgi:hypothetical protein